MQYAMKDIIGITRSMFEAIAEPAPPRIPFPQFKSNYRIILNMNNNPPFITFKTKLWAFGLLVVSTEMKLKFANMFWKVCILAV